MKSNKNIALKIFSTPYSTLKEVLVILLHIIKIQIIIWMVPLRFYYKTYFSNTKSHIPDKQLFHKYLSLYIRVFRLLPFKLTCLAESMVLYELLKRHGILNPIRIGIRMGDNLEAHAWNDHQLATDFKIIN
jgi:hypothetical protein